MTTRAVLAFFVAVLPLVGPLRESAAASVAMDQGTTRQPTPGRIYTAATKVPVSIPLPWIAPLKQPGGEPFMAASLSRDGYLPNEERPRCRRLYVGSGSNGQ